MIVLAIDTATPATVLGLRGADGRVLEAREDPLAGERPGHSTRLLGLAAELLAQAGTAWREIDRIAVGVGPGTFTGLRVGLATAHGLAQSSGAELVGVSSLRALALGADRTGAVLAAIDARRSEVFVSGYLGEMELLSPRVLSPAAVAAALAERPAVFAEETPLAVGDGAVRYREAFEQAGAQVPDDGSAVHRVRASALCELAVRAPVCGLPVLPDYLRRPDAAIPRPRPSGGARQDALEGAARQGAFEGAARQDGSEGVARQGAFEGTARQDGSEGVARQDAFERVARQDGSEGVARQGAFEGAARQDGSEGVARQGAFEGTAG